MKIVFANPSLMTRIVIGKTMGFILGLLGFIALPFLVDEADLLVRWGVLLWYTTLGAIVGVFGVFNWHPILKLPLPWWFRAPLLGAWMNFVLTFFAYDTLSIWMASLFSGEGSLSSPFWFCADGALVGLLIGYFATRFGGEGFETVQEEATKPSVSIPGNSA